MPASLNQIKLLSSTFHRPHTFLLLKEKRQSFPVVPHLSKLSPMLMKTC